MEKVLVLGNINIDFVFFSSRYPHSGGTFLCDDFGIFQGGKGANREDEMFVVGFDAVPNALDAIKAGDMKATVAQQPWMMGVLGVMNGYLVVNGVELGVEFIPVPLKLILE